MKRIILILIISIQSTVFVSSQTPIADYSLNCSLQDELNNYDDLTTAVFPGCECGVDLEQAFDISGVAQLAVDTSVSEILSGDFAISFYIMPFNSGLESAELINSGGNCSSDNLMRIYYLGGLNQEIIFEASESVQESVTLTGKLANNKCWNHIIASRKDNLFSLYINGELVDEVNFSSDILLNTKEPFLIGHGPCVGFISNEFDGLIDNLTFFDENIQPFRAAELYIRNDEILSSDTTIFEGDVIDLVATENCTGNISWLPSTGIANTTSFVTELEGIESNKYVAVFAGDFCVSTDSIQIHVIDPNAVECGEILLPNVFTPNGDGLNDEFGVLNGFIVEKLNYFEIYDRWGERVFQTTNKDVKWDGELKGKAMNSTMVLYKISYTCKGADYVKMGNVSILR